MAAGLLAKAGQITHLMADKSHDANALRELLARRGAVGVIPYRQPSDADPL
jgi:hypothetical protein